MNKISKKYVRTIVAIAVVGSGIVFLSRGGDNPAENSSANNLYLEQAISHGHGLAVDVIDPNKLYIATHYGLLVLTNEKDLYRVGKSKDDYMGFSPHPTDANVFFSSGHPSSGGNIGFQKSEDGGVTWKKVNEKFNEETVLHIAFNRSNPSVVYALTHENKLYKSSDTGDAWAQIR